jgi:hypothetical protein
MDSELQRITQLIRERSFAEAETALRAYVKLHPESPQAFYLLSYACDEPRERLAAIRRARKLAPENARIAERFRRLESGKDTPRTRRRSLLPLLLVTSVVIGALLAGLWVTFRDRLPAALGGSVVVLPTANVPGTDLLENQFIEATATAIEATNEQVRVFVEQTASAAPPTATESATPSPEVTAASPTATPTRRPTETPIVLLTATPSLTPFIPPTVVPFFTALPPVAPVGSTVDVAVGQFIVLSFNRAGEVFINEIGATIDPPPDGTEWALLELQLICNGETDCTPPLAEMRVVDTTGETYALATAQMFQAEPRFGPESFGNNQTYGYAAVALPPVADGLALTVTIAGQVYAFALQ